MDESATYGVLVVKWLQVGEGNKVGMWVGRAEGTNNGRALGKETMNGEHAVWWDDALPRHFA